MRLRVHGLSKRFGTHVALDAVGFDLPEVKSLILIGPSGGGKSTLLRILAGLEIPDAGEIEINGSALAFDDKSLLAHRRSIGTVFQMFNLFPHLSALRNITLPLREVHGVPEKEAAEIAMGLLEKFQLSAHATKRPAELSGGQKQRVAIARAVSIKPRLLLFDEPTSALDPEMTFEVLELIRRLRNEGRELVIVTHEMGFARRIADHVLVLSAGRIVESAPAERIFENPQSDTAKRYLELVSA